MEEYALPASFAIPFAKLDEEHGALIRQLNLLLAGVGSRNAADTAGVAETFLTGLREHFVHEEALMAELGYPRLDEHRSHHAECLGMAATILDGALSRGSLERTQVDEVFSLLINVVVRVDLYFEEYLIGIGLVADRAKIR